MKRFLITTAVLLAATAQAAQPGQSWSDLGNLPDWLNATWVPQNAPKSQIGFLTHMELPPLKPDYLAAAKQEIAAIAAGKQQSLSQQCRPESMPTLAWYPYPLQFIYGAGSVIIKESVAYRSFSTSDSLDHPKSLYDTNALQSFQMGGDETAQWQGDTLVIDTVKLREDRGSFYGAPNDPDVHIVERYHLVDHNTLERDTTITSPLVLTAPWQTRTLYRRAPAGSLASTFCMLPGEPVT